MMIPASYQGKQVGVFGLARSGRSVVRALFAAGATVVHWDDKAPDTSDLPGQSLDFRQWDFSALAAVVVSPGVPFTHPEPHPVVKAAQAAGVPVIGDVELFADALTGKPARVVGITGTNGKSTSTALLGHILEQAGLSVAVAGNIGKPLLDLEPLASDGVYVLELSSYQIDLFQSLHADVAIVLNMSPDHLDRHGTMDRYVAVKKKLVDLQGADGVAIIGQDDPYVRSIAEACSHTVLPVSVTGRNDAGVWVDDAGLLHDSADPSFILDLAAVDHLPGRHNWQNMAACYAAARTLGVAGNAIASAVAGFPGLPHRLEVVGDSAQGVRFVNDSKATNVAAATTALAAFERIHWICGGQGKGDPYDPLVALSDRLVQIYLIGAASEEIEAAFAGHTPTKRCGVLEVATNLAAKCARSGEVVLLSPACASFDQFRDFEDRGDQFRSLAQHWIAGEAA